MKKILTVTVPSYNVEKFLENTLDSFVDERVLDDIEVLIVDDGSKDKTAEIGRKYEEKYPDKTVIVLGSEGFGIRKKVKENCDILIKIPMHGKINSLNVSVAGGILLSEVAKSIY